MIIPRRERNHFGEEWDSTKIRLATSLLEIIISKWRSKNATYFCYLIYFINFATAPCNQYSIVFRATCNNSPHLQTSINRYNRNQSVGSAKLETVDSCRKERLCQVYHAVHVIWVTWHVHCHVSRPWTSRWFGTKWTQKAWYPYQDVQTTRCFVGQPFKNVYIQPRIFYLSKWSKKKPLAA